MKPLNIAIDISPLFLPRTGIGQYTANLIQGMKNNLNNDKLHYFTGIGWIEKVDLGVDTDNIKRRLAVRIISRSLGSLGKPGILLKNYFNKLYHDIYSYPVFLKGTKTHSIDIYHGTNYELYKTDIPSVLTIYDISCFRHPETHPAWRVRWQNKILPESIELANHIITISEYSKKEIVDYFNVPPENITVTHCGVNNTFTRKTRASCQLILDKFSLNYKKYILSVGTIEPRKNLITLLHAHTSLPDSVQKKYPLVLVGMKGWKETELFDFARKYIEKGTIRILGYIKQHDLPYLYSGASLFCYPSIYEGFGMPPLESMACGVPVIVSNRTSLPEVVGEAGIILDAHDINKWTESINDLLDNKELSAFLVEKGLIRSNNFTWDNTSKKTIAVYKKLTG